MDKPGLDMMSLFPDLEEFEGRPVELVADELKIERVELDPEKEGQCVVVGVAITPTRERPNLEIVILTPDGRGVAEVLLVESRTARQVVTMYLRPADPSLTYTVKVGLFWKDELVDVHESELTWPQ